MKYESENLRRMSVLQDLMSELTPPIVATFTGADGSFDVQLFHHGRWTPVFEHGCDGDRVSFPMKVRCIDCRREEVTATLSLETDSA